MDRRLFLAGALGLSGCASLATQHALAPAAGFPGPRLERDALVSFDGARLPMTVWPAEGEPWAVVVALHGMNDYAEAFTLAGPTWASQGVTTYAYDQRGFGRSAHRGVWGGEDLMTEDLRTACTLVRARHPKAILAVVGESMGGAVCTVAFASDRPPTADRLVLLSPAVWGWSDESVSENAALWIAAHMFPSMTLEPPSWLTTKIRATDNIEILRKMSRDPNLLFDTRVDTIYGLVDLMQHAQDRIGLVKVPLLYEYGGKDQVIPPNAAKHAIRRLGPTARTAFYPTDFHLLNRDLNRAAPLGDALAFIRDPNAALPSGAPPAFGVAR